MTRWALHMTWLREYWNRWMLLEVFLVTTEHTYAHLAPTWQDHDVLQLITAALKPLNCMTDALSGEHCFSNKAIVELLVGKSAGDKRS